MHNYFSLPPKSNQFHFSFKATSNVAFSEVFLILHPVFLLLSYNVLLKLKHFSVYIPMIYSRDVPQSRLSGSICKNDVIYILSSYNNDWHEYSLFNMNALYCKSIIAKSITLHVLLNINYLLSTHCTECCTECIMN